MGMLTLTLNFNVSCCAIVRLRLSSGVRCVFFFGRYVWRRLCTFCIEI